MSSEPLISTVSVVNVDELKVRARRAKREHADRCVPAATTT
jgi:hypothetical protein